MKYAKTLVALFAFAAISAQAAPMSVDKLKESAAQCDTDTACAKVSERARKYQAALEKKLAAIEKSDAKDAERDKKRADKKAAVKAELAKLKATKLGKGDGSPA